ncbi:MAG: hypothetical protein L3J12_08395 [Spirochaetales bacterium]|nr:hypothetical protein [Spirochaetales bacterium]
MKKLLMGIIVLIFVSLFTGCTKKYEYETLKVNPNRVSTIIVKMDKEGWELLSKTVFGNEKENGSGELYSNPYKDANPYLANPSVELVFKRVITKSIKR